MAFHSRRVSLRPASPCPNARQPAWASRRSSARASPRRPGVSAPTAWMRHGPAGDSFRKACTRAGSSSMTPPSGGCTNRVTPPASAARSASGDGEPSGPARRAHRSTRPGSTARPSASMRRSAWNPLARRPRRPHGRRRCTDPPAGPRRRRDRSACRWRCAASCAPPGASVRPSESDKRRSAASRSACSSARSWPGARQRGVERHLGFDAGVQPGGGQQQRIGPRQGQRPGLSR